MEKGTDIKADEQPVSLSIIAFPSPVFAIFAGEGERESRDHQKEEDQEDGICPHSSLITIEKKKVVSCVCEFSFLPVHPNLGYHYNRVFFYLSPFNLIAITSVKRISLSLSLSSIIKDLLLPRSTPPAKQDLLSAFFTLTFLPIYFLHHSHSHSHPVHQS